MRRVLLLGLLALVVALTGCTGSSSFMTAGAAPPDGPPPGKALVYFMRPSGLGFAVNFQIYHGEKLIGLSQAKSYFAYACDPGTQMFLGFAENQVGLKAELEAGKTYYAITQVRMGGWKARMGFIPVTRDSEYWDLVNAYQSKLTYISAKEADLAAWQAAKAAKVTAKLNEVYSFMETEKGKQYVLHLEAQDGR